MIIKAIGIRHTAMGSPFVQFARSDARSPFADLDREEKMKKWLQEASITDAVVGFSIVRFTNEEDAMLCLMSFA